MDGELEAASERLAPPSVLFGVHSELVAQPRPKFRGEIAARLLQLPEGGGPVDSIKGRQIVDRQTFRERLAEKMPITRFEISHRVGEGRAKDLTRFVSCEEPFRVLPVGGQAFENAIVDDLVGCLRRKTVEKEARGDDLEPVAEIRLTPETQDPGAFAGFRTRREEMLLEVRAELGKGRSAVAKTPSNPVDRRREMIHE